MKKMILPFTVILLLVFSLTACSGEKDNSSTANVEDLRDVDVVIVKADISETALFIPIEVDGTKMEIIAVKAPDGTIRTAFNTCQICYDSGHGYYEQDGDELVCQNCGNRFKMSQVSVEKGGCNPVGISDDMRTETDTEIKIPLTLMKQEVPLFENWQKS